MPPPTNVTELRSFLGAISQLSRFIQNLQSLCNPLHKLQWENQVFQWKKEEKETFQIIKSAMSKQMYLTLFDINLPLIIIELMVVQLALV